MSGEAALEWLEQHETLPDLILLDVMMPRMSGMKVARMVRKVGSPLCLTLTTRQLGPLLAA
jgi:CheY-like chemotaxis protein